MKWRNGGLNQLGPPARAVPFVSDKFNKVAKKKRHYTPEQTEANRLFEEKHGIRNRSKLPGEVRGLLNLVRKKKITLPTLRFLDDDNEKSPP